MLYRLDDEDVDLLRSALEYYQCRRSLISTRQNTVESLQLKFSQKVTWNPLLEDYGISHSQQRILGDAIQFAVDALKKDQARWEQPSAANSRLLVLRDICEKFWPEGHTDVPFIPKGRSPLKSQLEDRIEKLEEAVRDLVEIVKDN